MGKWLGRLALVLIILVAGALAYGVTKYGQFARSGTGITAKQMCSLVFVSKIEADRAHQLYLAPILGDATKLIGWKIDEEAQEATSSVLGFAFKSRAVFRPGLGCTLVYNGDYDPVETIPVLAPNLMTVDTAWRAEHFDEAALAAAMADVFKEDLGSTLGVAVLHQGRLVAEGYADGIDAGTPLHGWSMTKSTAATVIGALAYRGEIDVNAEGSVAALVDAGRPDITVDDLLRMGAGLDIAERNNGNDPNTAMLYGSADMAAYGANRPKVAEPGAIFDYQSGQTVLAGSAVEPFLGTKASDQMTALRELIFQPLGMNTAVIEPDQSGTLVWSSYMYASAQDWARMGQLYLDDGVAPDGTRIFAEDWRSYAAQPAEPSGGRYGAGFWLQESTPGLMIMQGFQGQYGFILPSDELVIVRLGADPGWNEAPYEFVRSVRRSMKRPDPESEAEPETEPEAGSETPPAE